MYYQVTGEAICTKTDEDNFTFQAPQLIEQIVNCVDPETVAQVGLDVWLVGHNWKEGKWIDGPFITELPADQVMNLAGAERLPGL